MLQVTTVTRIPSTSISGGAHAPRGRRRERDVVSKKSTRRGEEWTRKGGGGGCTHSDGEGFIALCALALFRELSWCVCVCGKGGGRVEKEVCTWWVDSCHCATPQSLLSKNEIPSSSGGDLKIKNLSRLSLSLQPWHNHLILIHDRIVDWGCRVASAAQIPTL